MGQNSITRFYLSKKISFDLVGETNQRIDNTLYIGNILLAVKFISNI